MIDAIFRTGKYYHRHVFYDVNMNEYFKKYFKNVNMMLKKKRCLSILLTKEKFLLMIVMKIMKKIKYRMCLDFYIFDVPNEKKVILFKVAHNI